MTRPIRIGGFKTAVAAFAILMAGAALAVLGTASSVSPRPAQDVSAGTVSLEPSPLGR